MHPLLSFQRHFKISTFKDEFTSDSTLKTLENSEQSNRVIVDQTTKQIPIFYIDNNQDFSICMLNTIRWQIANYSFLDMYFDQL